MSQRAKERILDILILLAALGLAVILIYPQYKMAQPTRVRILIDRSVLSLPVFAAEAQGLFKEYKLIPEIVTVEDPAKRRDALYRGECAFTFLPWAMILDEGHPVKVIGSAETRLLRPAEALLALPKSKIKRLRDLNRKKIGLLAETEGYFEELKQHFPLAIKRITEVVIEPEEITTLFSRRRVDCLFLFEPYRSLAVAQGARVIQDAPLAFFIQRGYPVAGYLINRDFIAKDRIGAQRLRNAIDAAFRYIIRNRADAKRLLYDRLNIEGDPANVALVEFQRMRELNEDAIRSYAQRFGLPVNIDSIIARPIDFER
ncbi:hypothetical protein DRP53_00315 [candidate division WOR-3 bacterium]|uniref:SsuA/THI5-like domain-containing protein n=1 Tax=candidate division WOR-3 bacterium TaxID=2052148 RepID=A0A660SLU2_UNCW3|nr:MAG: hypothetical protein DRP53_00315 [candidate division WOR-3 bacterium]